MKLKRSVRFSRTSFFLAAVIDILFLLLLFFVLSSNVVVQSGVSLELPQSNFTLALQPDPILVTLTNTPEETVYLEERRVSPVAFRERLRSRYSTDRSVIIKADESVSHGLIMQIANAALEEGHPVVIATALPEETVLAQTTPIQEE
jgi:biopolymer transport protein ExbD